jgi:hypothetical protein
MKCALESRQLIAYLDDDVDDKSDRVEQAVYL